MVKLKQISGRTFKFFEEGESGIGHESGVYEYRGKQIAKEWIDVGFDDRWRNYRETTVRRWVVIGERPYYQHNFTSITKAADHVDKMCRGY
jgi:hypothetical protein